MQPVDMIPRPIYNGLRRLVFPHEQFVSSALPLSGRVLDVGGGVGIIAAEFLRRSPAIKQYTLVDSSAQKIAAAKRNLQPFGNRALCVLGDATESEGLGYFDAIILVDVLHHLTRSEKGGLLQKLIQKLNPGGVMIIKDLDDKPRLGYYLNWIHDSVATMTTRLDFPPFSLYEETCEAHGLTIDSVSSLNATLPYNHRLLIARRPD